jgi:site-specific DNA recombinase
MKAIGYKRLSDEDQSNYSLSAQEQAIREYCQRNKLELVNIFEDNGQSSYTFDRKAFTLLEKELRGVHYLVVYHLDRFSRNMAEAMLKIKQYLERGIRVRDITEPLDLDDHDPNTFLLRSMKFMVAESELHRIRQRTRNGILQAARNGRHVNMAPFGYKNERDENNKPIITIDEEKAFVVRVLFREFLNGMEIEQLRSLCKRYGFHLKGNSAIQRILGNPIYAGLIRVPATNTMPAHLVRGIHTPLISEQDYWLAQDRLHGKKITVQNREEVPLRGVLHCWCGKKMTAGNSKGKTKYYWYYLCQQHRQNLSANRLHAQFNELLDNLSFDPRDLEVMRKQIIAKVQAHIDSRGERMESIRKQLAMVENKITTLEEKYLRGADVSERTFQKIMAEYKADRSRLYRELATANTNQQAYWDKLESVLLRMTDLKTHFEKLPLDKKHQFINLVFDNQLSYEDGSYRTPNLLSIFRHNEQKLKEKGLLLINSPVRNLGEIPIRTRDGS